DARPIDDGLRTKLDEYARLFNARDWDGVRALVGDDCQLDLVSKFRRSGKAVGMYFSNYEKQNVRLEVRLLEGRPVLAAFVDGNATASYVVLLDFANGQVTSIRHFRYVPYIVTDANLT